MTAKYGLPYFQNFLESDLKPHMVRSMCCRPQLDLRELLKRGPGLFRRCSATTISQPSPPTSPHPVSIAIVSSRSGRPVVTMWIWSRRQTRFPVGSEIRIRAASSFG
ncbi:Ribonucleotide reductase of class III (anaerobic), large subunit [Rhodovulum sp. PH10]|nr:Ribonucleotide reductase of class III (anaerobic), large subunit [Rhodovulum sp. PH10]